MVKNLAKNPDELEMNTPQIWSKTWVPGRIRNEHWSVGVKLCMGSDVEVENAQINRLH